MDLTLQSDRRRQLVDKLCHHALLHYSPDGSFHGPYTQPDQRDRFRLAAVLAEHGGTEQLALAETILLGTFGGPERDYTQLSLEENVVDLTRADVRDWGIFESNMAPLMLARHRERFSAETRGKLERLTRRNFSRWAGSAQADYFFHGANDNMPAHATAGLLVGGALLGDAQALADGAYRLQLFAEMLSRRGLCSEYSSGTYLPITIGGLAEIAELAGTAQLRELALQIEQQLWADVVCHYHPGSGKNGGGQTRAYNVNTIGHLDAIMLLLWVATGEPAFADPVRDIITLQPKQVTHFEGDAFKTACGLVYAMTPHFHFPEHLAALLTDRPYPFRFFASAEQMHAAPDAGGRDAFSTVYQTADYSLSSSNHGFMTGNQSEKLRITYRRVAQPESFRDTGVLFSRYLHNDEIPGARVQQENCAPGECGLVQDRALTRTVQQDALALLVTRADAHGVPLPAEFTRLRLAVNLPAHYHEPEEVYLGTERVDNFTAACAEPRPVFIDLGRLYVALYPLVMTDHGRADLIRLEAVGDYRMVSFFNYEGPARRFDAEELQGTFNGYVVQVSGPEESGSFAQFRQAWRLDLVEDYWLANNRRTRVVVGDTELLHHWSTPSDTVRSVTINGEEPPRDRLRGTGLDVTQFPLQERPYRPLPDLLHYDNLAVAWYPDLHWQIGQRERGVTADEAE
jgi:hypothetical protein